jgi:ring-1,2-phenylacetyl-CoA epoxidase subunit PaaC
MNTLHKYYLQIADNALILSHRLSENCSKGPFLEEDLATTNVALDFIGLAESVYEEIAKQRGNFIGDDFAYRRNENEYVNAQLVEQENGDFAQLMTRQFFMDVFHYHFFSALTASKDAFLVALAHKSLKEVKYHVKRSSEWMIRFGRGTSVSRSKALNAIHFLFGYTTDLFQDSAVDIEMRENGVGVDLAAVQALWLKHVLEILDEANLELPEKYTIYSGGKRGIHSEGFGYLLAEMQFLTNKYQDAIW